MATHSIVEAESGLVVNVIAVGPGGLPQDWPVPEGHLLVRQDGGQIGGTWDGQAFHPPEPTPAAPSVPDRVNNSQMRAALLAAGHLAAVEAFLDGLPEPDRTVARVGWEYGNEIFRVSPLVQAAQVALALTDEQMDGLFIAASAIEF